MKALVQSPEDGSDAGRQGYAAVPEVRTYLQPGALIRFLVMRVTSYVILITSAPPFDPIPQLRFNAIKPIPVVIAITAHHWLDE
jgi:hypothetical protein